MPSGNWKGWVLIQPEMSYKQKVFRNYWKTCIVVDWLVNLSPQAAGHPHQIYLIGFHGDAEIENISWMSKIIKIVYLTRISSPKIVIVEICFCCSY